MMKNQIRIFESPEFGMVRTSIDGEGNPLFCGKDVCDILGYKKTQNAVNQHVSVHDALKQGVRVTCGRKADGSPAIKQIQMLFVNESGFYCLVFGSKLPIAERFKHWVTSAVLPQIRKTGGYIPLGAGDTDEQTIRRAEQILRKTLQQKDTLIAEQQKLIAERDGRIAEQGERIRCLEGQVGEQLVRIQKSAEEILDLEHDIDRFLPKALYADNVLDSISCYTTTQIAKELGMTAQELNRLLCAEHVQYYQSGQYMLYAEYAHQGLAKSRTRFELFVGRDTVCTRMYLVWTERGRKFIHGLAKA